MGAQPTQQTRRTRTSSLAADSYDVSHKDHVLGYIDRREQVCYHWVNVNVNVNILKKVNSLEKVVKK